MSQHHPNDLIDAESPYLQQHAHNPVHWMPWGKEALQKARNENKPIIVSIGYAACHWCHVMAHESFENDEIAAVMNEHFICIKVDREERPDIDQIYMEAVQAMGIAGGWPLNIFTMPDQRPFYGGTYFPPRQWIHVLKNIAQAFSEQHDQLEESAKEFTKALKITDTEKYALENHGLLLARNELQHATDRLANDFDHLWGGLKGAPKFPNPSLWNFLLTAGNRDIQNHVRFTLQKMALGGIYDQVGGGFARYAVDDRWFAPHFEKMLYDNAQLVYLYAEAYRRYQDPQFKAVVYETIDFVKQELTSPAYAFYSSLDADSEGQEGAYYVWGEAEIDNAFSADVSDEKKYFGITDTGNWEDEKNILFSMKLPEEFAKENNLPPTDFNRQLQVFKQTLKKARNSRLRPGLDDKILTAWNALMIRALTHAYTIFEEASFLELAQKNMSFFHEFLFEGPQLLRRPGKQKIYGFLDDYAFTIDAFLSLYFSTYEEKYLDKAQQLLQYTIEAFYDTSEGMFFYTHHEADGLIARKKEIFDSVIPSSNSVMAHNLFWLGQIFQNEDYLNMAADMVASMQKMIVSEPRYLAHWGTLHCYLTSPLPEIVIIGPAYNEIAQDLQRHVDPPALILAAPLPGSLPAMQHRASIDGKTTIYVCFNKTCKLPVFSIEDALQLIKDGITDASND